MSNATKIKPSDFNLDKMDPLGRIFGPDHRDGKWVLGAELAVVITIRTQQQKNDEWCPVTVDELQQYISDEVKGMTKLGAYYAACALYTGGPNPDPLFNAGFFRYVNPRDYAGVGPIEWTEAGLAWLAEVVDKYRAPAEVK